MYLLVIRIMMLLRNRLLTHCNRILRGAYKQWVNKTVSRCVACT